MDLDNPSEEDKHRAQEGLIFAKKALDSEPNLLVLDEIGLAAHSKLINIDKVTELLNNIPEKTDVVLTGR